MKPLAMILTLAALLWMAGPVLAMSSDNYRLEWFVPLTAGGGGPAVSSNFAVNFTVGQTANGSSSSASYRAGFGYWHGIAAQHAIYLPLLWRSFP